MTGIASLIGWDTVILEVRGSEVGWIVHIQTTTMRIHGMAGQAEIGTLGLLKFRRKAHGHTEQRQKEQNEESEDLSRLLQRVIPTWPRPRI